MKANGEGHVTSAPYNKQLHPELTGNKQMYDSENYSILELD
nr:MAG TPA: hypothetical protein [Bacteriophage sp.]